MEGILRAKVMSKKLVRTWKMKRQSVFTVVIMFIVALLISVGTVEAVVLYDGSLGPGTQTPANQGWLYLTDPLTGASATQSATGGVTTLDTTGDITDSAGYFSTNHPAMPTLDPFGDGYTVRFTARIDSENHNNNDRAGFSIIALSSNVRGVEIAFWTDEIWTQLDSPLFTHGEGAAFDTTADLVVYDVAIHNNTYDLYANGSPILSGTLRDYSAHPLFVYSTPNFLFFGDDTSSAAAVGELAYIEVMDYAVPEPSGLLLLGLAAVFLRKKRPVTS